MASVSNFIGEFRQAVVSMQDAYDKAKDLAEFATALGWDETTIGNALGTSSDITGAEFVAAMTIILGIETQLAGIATPLAKMRP